MRADGAVILAGGKSRRMGYDKASLLTEEGLSILERTVDALYHVTDRLVVVVDQLDRIAHTDELCILDLYPDAGPLGGIITGLRHLGKGHHIVVGCDMPLLSPVVLSYLLEVIGEHEAAIPEIGGSILSSSCGNPATLY